MELSAELVAQLLKVFETELAEQVQVITDVLLDLEKGMQGEARKQALDSMFRAAHNTKGAARGVSVNSVADIAHELETLFIEFKEQRIAPDAQTIDLCLASLDHMTAALFSHLENKPLTFDLAAVVQQLNLASKANDNSGKKDRKPEISQVPEQQEAPRAIPAQKSIQIDIEKVSSLAAHAEQLQTNKIHFEDNLVDMQHLNEKIQQVWGSWRHAGTGRAGKGTDIEANERLFSETINSLNELTVISGQIQQTMNGNGKRLGLLTDSLQNDVRMMRLVPVATLLRPMGRIVRDIARELGKKVKFTTSGDEIEIDRKVLDGIRDPLIHLVRNSIDHGIEQPAERTKSGKPEHGHIKLNVNSAGGEILLTIQDDGAGISEKKIAQTALRKNLLSEDELKKLDSSELLELIFRPGFSSKEIITHISGRGVGLDVVRANLRSLKGNVQISTQVGKFTRFTLTLPLTLATDRGLVVSVGGQDFAVPTTNVDRVLTIEQQDIAEVSGGRALLLDDRTIPIVDLARVLKLTSLEPMVSNQANIVIVSRAWNVVAFKVDEIIGERELVIKALLPPLHKLPKVSGGTQTGSGDIIVVLNPEQILESALMPGMTLTSTDQNQDVSEQARPHILVVDDSISVRTLEKSIFENHGYQVSEAADGEKAWQAIQKNAFDLIVTDIEMPFMDGFELISKVKHNDKYSDIPVIIVSSLTSDADHKRGIKVGADAYIVKGKFETKALIEVVVQLV